MGEWGRSVAAATWELAFRTLCANATVLTDTSLSSGGTMAMKWPTPCAYWCFRQVKNYLQEHNLQKVKKTWMRVWARGRRIQAVDSRYVIELVVRRTRPPSLSP